MVTDARGHEVPVDSDMWGYREDMGLLSASIADVRAVPDEAAATAAIAELDSAGIDSAGTVWWLANPGELRVWSGSEWVTIADETDVEAVQTSVDDLGTSTSVALARLPYAVAVGTRSMGNISAGQTKNFTVTFPSGRFAAVPAVALGLNTGLPHGIAIGYSAATATGFTMNVFNDRSATISSVSCSWTATQSDTVTELFAAAEAGGVEPDAVATCPTDQCSNQDIAIPIVSTWTDEDGTTQPVDGVYCGVCNAEITASLQEA